jgi:ABC-type xylose transport system substrate-binding protein
VLALSLLSSASAFAQTAVTDATVAFLMPDQASTRYEEHDYPGFQAEMAKSFTRMPMPMCRGSSSSSTRSSRRARR